MKAQLLFLFFSIAFSGQAQKPPIKFGDVSVEELKMVRYDKDTSAAALVIADYGESVLEYDLSDGFRIHFERLRRIKIFKKDGYLYADFSISLYHSSKAEEKLTGLKAVTYNLEGSKIVETKLKNDAIFKEKADNNIDLVKITLPNIKEGSVIEISYKITSEFLFNFQDWEFQTTIPVKWSEYRAKIPEYFEYQKYMQGYVALTLNEAKPIHDVITITTKERSSGKIITRTTFETEKIDFTRNDYRWVAEGVPAFKEEPYMNNTVDYISKMNFELSSIKLPNSALQNYMSSWESLNNEFLDDENFGKVLTGSGFLNDDTKGLVNGISDPNEKAVKIYAFVKDNVEWDGYSRKFVNDSFKKVLEQKKGNCAEINLLLVCMLQKAGLDANPVLISTRNHGFIRRQFPVSSQFNYVICALTIGGKIFLLDGTDRSLPMNILPERCLNGEGFVISKEKSGWIPLVSNFKSRTVTNFDLALDASGQMSGTISISRDGYDAQRMRKTFHSKGEQNYLNDLSSTRQWELQKSTFDNTQKTDATVLEIHELKIGEHIQTAGDVMYLNPLVAGRIGENPFKAEKRVYPVDFGSPSEQICMGKFTLPTGYSVEELPIPKVLKLPNAGGKYTYSVFQAGDKIQFMSQLVINQPLFSQEEYTNLREFYNQVVTKQAEQIVIRKK